MDLLSKIINAEDYIGQSPLYMLCEKGYDKEPENGQKPKEHADRLAMIKLLYPSLDSEEGKNPENLANVKFVCKQTLYQPLHWLAYWNDSASIQYILKTVEEQMKSPQDLKDLMSLTNNGLTIVDVAGSNGSHESALVILNLLSEKFEMIE